MCKLSISELLFTIRAAARIFNINFIRTNKLIIAISLLISSCGFHLRGMSEVPSWLAHVSIVSQKVNRDIAPLLTDLLISNHIQVDQEPRMANYWIILEEDSLKQNITSISSGTNARQYQLVYSLRFKLENTQNPEASHAQTITVIRQLTVNSQRILGSSDEQNILESEMHLEAIQLLLTRLGTMSQ